MGFIDHDLSQYKNDAERMGYIVICVGSVIESIAVFLAFARLNANMFGLINKEDDQSKGCWHAIENSWVKKGIGSFAVLFKVFNTAVSAYNFFKNKLPLEANLTFVSYSSIAGLFAQSSILICDPLKEDDFKTAPDLLQETRSVEDKKPDEANKGDVEIELSSSDEKTYLFSMFNRQPRTPARNTKRTASDAVLNSYLVDH
jgi:hypothetical protein